MRDDVALLTAIRKAAGSNRGHITGCPNFLHRYSDVHFCVYFSLPSWQYFKECPCGLLKLKAFFSHNYPDRYFPSFLCVFFICILTRVSLFSLSSILTVDFFFFVFFATILTEVTRFCVYCDWRFSWFSLWLVIAELSWLHLLFFFNFSIRAFLRWHTPFNYAKQIARFLSSTYIR